MATLAELCNIEPDLLREKFLLEPRHQYNEGKPDNLVFVDPTILLRDLQLSDGGFQQRSAKDVLGLVIKDILTDNDIKLFQVPEITDLHMGYAKEAKNKEKKMAINGEEAQFWFDYLNLSRFKDGSDGEEPMDIELRTSQDAQPSEDHIDTVDPSDSGLLVKQRGSYILFFSILLILDPERKNRKPTGIEKEQAVVGPNKISDFLLFWIVPYLLNFSQRKVNEIIKHKEFRKEEPPLTVKKSAKDIFISATSHPDHEIHRTPRQINHLLEKYRRYYGSDLLAQEYTLLATNENSPIIFVPIEYQLEKTMLPIRIQEIGDKAVWRKIGKYKFTDEFLSKFVLNREIQRDFFDAMKDAQYRQAIDYGIILPDEITYGKLKLILESDKPDRVREFPSQGRSFISPSVCLLENKVAVAFSYLQGTSSDKIAALFRAIGAHYRNHFTLAILHCSVLNVSDPDCRLGNLYPIENGKKLSFEAGFLRKTASLSQVDLLECIGKFSLVKFPRTYMTWENEVCQDEAVQKLIRKTGIRPAFHRDSSIIVGYAEAKDKDNLRCIPLGATMAITKVDKGDEEVAEANREKLSKYKIRAVNLSGCAVSLLTKHGRKRNIALVGAINGRNDKNDSGLAWLPSAVQWIVVRFVMAVIIAGLPEVYPSQEDAEDRGEEEMADETYSSEDSDSDDEESREDPKAPSAPVVKDGTPTDVELEMLAAEIPNHWEKLGRRLQVPQSKIIAFDKENEKVEEKAFQMLWFWIQRDDSDASYQVLYDALCHELVGRKDLAKKFCCS